MMEHENDFHSINEEIKQRKIKSRNKFRKGFNTFASKFNCHIIKEYNNIVHFIFNGQEYYFVELNGNVWKKGNKNKIFKMLEIFQNQN